MNELITVVNEKPILDSSMVVNLIDIQNKMKELKELEDNCKKAIKEAMEEKGIIKLLDDISGLSITYIPAQNNLEKFNKEKFQEENPDLYDKYVTMDGKRASYITIRTK